MCGIAFLAELRAKRLRQCCAKGEESPPHFPSPHFEGPSVLEIEEALSRRGPDSLSSLTLPSELLGFCTCPKKTEQISSAKFAEPCEHGPAEFYAEQFQFFGASLQLRGTDCVRQPLQDAEGNVLLFNGEIFGGLPVAAGQNDGEALLKALEGSDPPGVLARLRGPWALIYWQAAARRLWYGRDVIGRRSLLLHRPCERDSRFLLSSVSPPSLSGRESQGGNESTADSGESGKDSGNQIVESESVSMDSLGLVKGKDEAAAGLLRTSQGRTRGSKERNGGEGERGGGREGGDRSKVGRGSETVQGDAFDYWEEVPCGIFSCVFKCHVAAGGEGDDGESDTWQSSWSCEEHAWEDPLLERLSMWEQFRSTEKPLHEDVDSEHTEREREREKEGHLGTELRRKDEEANLIRRKTNVIFAESDRNEEEMEAEVDQVLAALSRAVERRVKNIRSPWKHGDSESAKAAVLFSGGLDSMLLAVLADRHVAPAVTIELLNVSFDGASAPDRKSALAALKELRHLAPHRTWQLVKVDASLADLDAERLRLLALICPAGTHMDLNIGAALWLAAGGEGSLEPEKEAQNAAKGGSERDEMGEEIRTPSERRDWTELNNDNNNKAIESGMKRNISFVARSRVVLVGTGADEQCGGYARYRTKFRSGGWEALDAEMRLDMRRLWRRNLGRDDRCIADRGREARFPFLDEEFMELLLSLPLPSIVDLRLPAGVGDKLILRKVARKLGIVGAATLPKRAIQFGSRIARESNTREFGSNRAANQLSAGGLALSGLGGRGREREKEREREWAREKENSGDIGSLSIS